MGARLFNTPNSLWLKQPNPGQIVEGGSPDFRGGIKVNYYYPGNGFAEGPLLRFQAEAEDYSITAVQNLGIIYHKDPSHNPNISPVITLDPLLGPGHVEIECEKLVFSKAGLSGNPVIADGTYSFYNDGTTSGQVTSITFTCGVATGISVLP